MLNYIILQHGENPCGENWESPGNTLNYHKIYYCLAGSAVYQEGKNSVRLTPGNLYIFPQNTPYRMMHSEEKHFEVLWFHVDTHMPLIRVLYQEKIQQDSMAASVIAALRVAKREQTELLPELLELLVRTLQIPNQITDIHGEVIRKCITYICTHMNEKITNDVLAEISGYHKHYMIRIFRECLGYTPRQYIIYTKFHYVIPFLKKGKSVGECAALIGYENESAFSRDFKTLFRVSPGQYRKLLQVSQERMP